MQWSGGGDVCSGVGGGDVCSGVRGGGGDVCSGVGEVMRAVVWGR